MESYFTNRGEIKLAPEQIRVIDELLEAAKLFNSGELVIKKSLRNETDLPLDEEIIIKLKKVIRNACLETIYQGRGHFANKRITRREKMIEEIIERGSMGIKEDEVGKITLDILHEIIETEKKYLSNGKGTKLGKITDQEIKMWKSILDEIKIIATKIIRIAPEVAEENAY